MHNGGKKGGIRAERREATGGNLAARTTFVKFWGGKTWTIAGKCRNGTRSE